MKSLFPSKSSVALLRLPFSFFLMPVFWFAFSQVMHPNIKHTVLVFFILHFLLYPASNAYNSYMDKDSGSIGGIRNPPQPTVELFRISIVLDALAVLVSLFISWYFTIGVILFIAASKAYSYRGVRLKKYPVTSFILASGFQGSMVYFLVFHGCSVSKSLSPDVFAMISSGLLVGCFYPLTQIFQHESDKADGIKTMSMLLGYRGTFYFSALMFVLCMMFMGYYFASNLELDRFLLITLFMIPVLICFFWWLRKVKQDSKNANFTNSLRMNIIAACCTNAAFITITLMQRFE